VARIGDPDDLGRARDAVSCYAAYPQDVVYKATLPLFDAIAARRRGDVRNVRGPAELAAQAFRELGCPLWEAEACELAGRVPDAAIIYRRIGAVDPLRRIEVARMSPAVGSTRAGVLTPRERDVALLVAAGKGNRATAERLAISEKAVEKYLTSIYTKLGMTSRAQLAAYVAASGTTFAEEQS
jgi:DNA-binding CsgD family transcriptional regulator